MTKRLMCGALGAAAVLSLSGAAWAEDIPERGRPPFPHVVAGPDRPAVVEGATLALSTPWMRATPPGAAVAGGFVRITNRGARPDRLVGAAIPVSAAAEVHQTTMRDGIARMAPVEGGIEIRPGETVELKPGGLHLMFTGLTGSLKAGDSVAGTLVFREAGPVPVVFSVLPPGSPGPSGGAGAPAAAGRAGHGH